MRLLESFRRSIRKGIGDFPSTGGGYGVVDPYGFYNLLPGTQYDYRSDAGLLWDNSIVMAGIQWISTKIPEAVLGLGELRNGRPNGPFDPNYPSVEIIRQPNGDYDGSVLWSATTLSLVADGNAFWRKVRDRHGNVTELWYVPHFMMGPVWPRDGSEFITGYAYRVQGKTRILPKDEVVHLRHHVMDPLNQRLGIAPLKSALREICTDNEISTFNAALLRNMGMPGAIISPGWTTRDGDHVAPGTFNKDQRESLLRTWREKFTGDDRGMPLIGSVPIKLEKTSWSPKELMLESASERPEERICALLNIHPAVLPVGTGLKHANNRASYDSACKATYRDNIIPTQDRLASQLGTQLLVDFDEAYGPKPLVYGWDRSTIELLNEGEGEKVDRAIALFESGVATRDECRMICNLGPAGKGGADYGSAGGPKPKPAGDLASADDGDDSSDQNDGNTEDDS